MMVEVEIRGKNFPLCLTVAALDKVNEKCGGLKNLSNFMKGDGDSGKSICNTVWMLGLLIQEGEENRLVEARFSGEKAERRAVPDSSAIMHLLTPGAAQAYRLAVWNAVNESMHQGIEAEYSKNAENAEQA